MFLEAIPKSISPAVPGWWARFKDDDCGEWWSPIAAWYPANSTVEQVTTINVKTGEQTT